MTNRSYQNQNISYDWTLEGRIRCAHSIRGLPKIVPVGVVKITTIIKTLITDKK